MISLTMLAQKVPEHVKFWHEILFEKKRILLNRYKFFWKDVDNDF